MPKSPSLSLLALALISCGSDIKVAQTALCDGVLQASEDEVDAPFDRDGDGYFDGSNRNCQEAYDASVLDCNDADPSAYPGNDELPCDGVDNDCDETSIDEEDYDGDRFTSCEDCLDSDATVNPAQTEVACNGVDDDCNEDTPDGEDVDNDTYDACVDCNDARADINPGAVEIQCNGVDEDCNEVTTDGDDFDADGFTACDDCDDSEEAINPGHDEECENAVDDDCDGDIDENCDTDYSGSWDLDSTSRYSCAFGLVSINFDAVFIVDAYPDITVSSTGSGSQPGTMTGSFTSRDTFEADRTITGGCNEIYAISGTFVDDNNFDATFTASFRGSGCFDCADQTFSFSGSR